MTLRSKTRQIRLLRAEFFTFYIKLYGSKAFHCAKNSGECSIEPLYTKTILCELSKYMSTYYGIYLIEFIYVYIFQLDLLDAVEERNSITCKDEDITLQFAIQSLYRDIASKSPGKCMLVLIPDSTLINDSAKTFQYATEVNVFIADVSSTGVPENVDVVFMSAETAAKLCTGVAPAFLISEVGACYSFLLSYFSEYHS